MADSIEGKIVIITGASSGMGEAAARHLAARGASIVVAARRAARIEKLVAEIGKAGGKAIAVATDVTKQEDMRKLADTALEKFGRVDADPKQRERPAAPYGGQGRQRPGRRAT